MASSASPLPQWVLTLSISIVVDDAGLGLGGTDESQTRHNAHAGEPEREVFLQAEAVLYQHHHGIVLQQRRRMLKILFSLLCVFVFYNLFQSAKIRKKNWIGGKKLAKQKHPHCAEWDSNVL